MTYPFLDNFMGAYLNQDYTLSGDSIEAIVDVFKHANGAAAVHGLREDAARFRLDHAASLDRDFAVAYETEIDLSGFGHDAASFLDLLVRRLAA